MRSVCARFFVALSCLAIFAIAPAIASAAATSTQQAQLQAELNQINQQIAANQAKLATEQEQRATLENQVSILDSQIEEAQLEIQQRNLTIQQEQNQIAQTKSGIADLDTQVAAGQASLAQIIRETAQINNTPLAIQVLNGTLADAFNDVDDFETLQHSLNAAFTKLAAQKSDLAARQQSLQDQYQQQNDLLSVQKVQEAALQSAESQKQQLVAQTKGQESIYQQIIANQQENAAQIKAQLFSLNNASHSTSFGDMYEYAKEASAKTGVEPAFILAILTEESNLGQNVGNCTYESAMSPKRDIPDYLTIMQQLGLSPDSEKVSCAQSYGAYGGAMGPAQFIPSTWMLYQDRIATASGQNPPNPWDPRTATFATAIYMSDLGASTDTAAAEREAALKYLAGSHWQNTAYAFYGNAVMCYTQQYQQNIDVLNGQGSADALIQACSG